jgi:uncharacterized membrane protein
LQFVAVESNVAAMTSSVSAGGRLRSIDVERGAVMVLMAVDHVRVYSGIPAGGPTPGVFFTRWITNFCAPAFVFLAGSSIFLRAERLQNRTALSRWLVVRGVWLVVLELTYLRLAWTFNADFANYTFAGVIWMLGWNMILMAALVHLPLSVVGLLGIAIMGGHNLVVGAIGDSWEPLLQGSFGWLWRVLYAGGGIAVGGDKPNFWVLYCIIPWTGVMAAGYAFGAVLRMAPERRRWTCYALGGSAILAFLLVQSFNTFRQPPGVRDVRPPIWFTFLTANKYPPSLVFLLMTLGPTIAALPLLEHAQGRIPRWLAVFGRVPLFYYLMHIPLIHAVAVGISLVRTPAATVWLFGNHPVAPGKPPAGYTWSLVQLYLVTALVVAALYFPCRWFAELKSRRKDVWLSYL